MDPEGASCRRKRRLKRRVYINVVSQFDNYEAYGDLYKYMYCNDFLCNFICPQGPNFVWHMDGYDNLSRFGLTIHGCIDGYVLYI